MPYPQVSYSRADALMTISNAFPAQNTTAASTGSIDLGVAAPNLAGTDSDLVLTLPATSTATGQTFTFTVQDSADNVTFAATGPIARLAPAVITGVASATAAQTFTWRLPANVRRYINVTVTASATTGNQTALSYTLQVLT